MSSGLMKGASAGIRSEFEELTLSELQTGNTSNGAVAPTNVTSAVRLIKLKQMAKVFYIDNSTNVPLAFYAVSHEDPSRTRSLWLKVPAGKMVNFELAANNMLIEAGTEIWVSQAGAAPGSGSVCMFTWG